MSIWGRVRPATAPVTAELQIQQGSGAWRTLQNVTTDAKGSFTLRGVVPQRAALAPALDGARRHGPHGLADSRVRPRVEARAWQPSSGSFATARPNRTTHDRTPTGG